MARKKPKRSHSFSCEAELCEEFALIARAQGFRVYAETGGFDLLLVATENTRAKGFRPYDQIGVQAKLLDNIEVLYQALPQPMQEAQPDFYCVLAPCISTEFSRLALRLKVTTIAGTTLTDIAGNALVDDFDFNRKIYWHRQTPSSRCWVPPCEVAELRAGIAGPVKLTRWKADAIRLCMRGVTNGFLTRADFRDYKISMTRWLKKSWVVSKEFTVVNGRRVKRYELVDENKPPHIRYGVVMDAMDKAGCL